jgi:hypothetical protein
LSDREDFIDNLADTEPADTANEPIDTPADEPVSTLADEPTDAPEPIRPSETEGAKALLESISEPDPNAAPRGPDGKFLPKESRASEGEKEPEKPAEPNADADSAARTDKPAEAKTLDEQEAEALEGIKSERGRERIKAVFAERKALEAEKQALHADINEFREMVTSTGMAPQEFAQMLEVGRLIKSNDPRNMQVALQMIDSQRAELAKALGVELPGVDLLADFPDLKAATENLEITPDRAAEIAKYRRAEQQQMQVRQAQVAQQQSMQQFQQSIDTAAQQADAIFATFKHEVDYPAKMQQIQQYLQQPGKVNEIVQTYQPHQWPAYFRDLYQQIRVVAQPAPRQIQQPIRSRPAMAGAPQSNPNEPLTNRLMSHIDSLGI